VLLCRCCLQVGDARRAMPSFVAARRTCLPDAAPCPWLSTNVSTFAGNSVVNCFLVLLFALVLASAFSLVKKLV